MPKATRRRVIITKYRTFKLPAAAQGVPVADYFLGVTLPEPLRRSGAKVYETSDGPVVAMPTSSRTFEPEAMQSCPVRKNLSAKNVRRLRSGPSSGAT